MVACSEMASVTVPWELGLSKRPKNILKKNLAQRQKDLVSQIQCA